MKKIWALILAAVMALTVLSGALADAEEDAYAVFGGDGAKVVRGEPEYEIRFKIVEIVEKALDRIRESKEMRKQKSAAADGRNTTGPSSRS